MSRQYTKGLKQYARDYTGPEEVEAEVEVEQAPREFIHRDRSLGRVPNVRVELKRKFNDPMKNFKEMLQEFKRRVSNRGIMRDLNDHKFFESKSEKKRKARNAATKKFQMEAIENKIITGEPVKASAGLVKKVMANMRDKKEKQNKKDRNNNYKQYQDDDY